MASQKLSLFKRGWNEIPEVVGSSLMACIGIGLLAIGIQNYYAKNGDNKRYRDTYTVIRHDDPRVQTLRKDYFGDQK